MKVTRTITISPVLTLFLALSSAPSLFAQISTTAQVAGPPASCANSGTTSASCSSVLGLPLYPGSFGGSASASAAYGRLGASASAVTQCNLAPGQNCAVLEIATSSADFADTLTIANAPPSGTVNADLQINGSQGIICTGPSCGNGYIAGFLGVSGVVFPQGALLPLISGTTFLTVPVPFTSSGGTATVRWAFGLQLTARCYADDTTSCTDSVDFSHTVTVTRVTVVDANGILVPGATITSGSGTNYNTAAGTVTFAAFTARLESEGLNPPGLELSSKFTLGAGSNGINPLAEAVSFQVGPLSGTVAPGLFKNRNGTFVYEGVINGADVDIRIKPVINNQYAFSIEAANALLPSGTPLTVGLTIGDDTGMTIAKWDN